MLSRRLALAAAIVAGLASTHAAGSGTFVVPPTMDTGPTKQGWTFPAPLTSEPPAEIWLPHALSDEDKVHRARVDQALMAADHIADDDVTNAGILQDELKAGRYDDMEAQLGKVRAKFLADPIYELLLQDSANFAEQGHAHGSVADTALIEAWVKARPDSAWAHYSMGLRRSQEAWQARGNGWAKDVSEKQWAEMHKDDTEARDELESALKIDPSLSVAWAELLDVDRTDSDLQHVTADFNRGAKQVPTSYLLVNQYEETLEPRWMGSAGMMDDFAQSKLADLDRNPRFWDLQGDAVADSGGCAACDHHAWEVSLKQYNSALTYADRASWLAAAGRAAMHVHRYALAHAYYDRALVYLNDFYWRMFRDFTLTLCDPKKTADEVERYRQDVVKFGGLDDEKYPHGPDDCVVYQRELPWGAEPVPDASGIRAYAIDDIGHPDFVTEPQTTTLTGQTKSATSPDGAWSVTLVQGEDKVNHLVLRGKAGQEIAIYSSTSGMTVGFTSDGKRLFVSDWTQGNSGGCIYFDPQDPMHHISIKTKLLGWAADQHLALAKDTVKATCTQFINDDMILASLSGTGSDGKPVFKMFNYDTVSGGLAPIFQH